MRHQRISQEAISSCRCLTTSHGDQETMKKNACQMLDSFFYMQRDLEQDNGHFLVLVRRKSGILSVQSPQGEWDRKAEDDVRIWRKQTSSLPCYESFVQRSAQKQRRWKIINTLLCPQGDWEKWRKNDVRIRRKRTSIFPCFRSIVQRSTQKQSKWKTVNTLLCRLGHDTTETIVSVHQLSLYGAVAEMCEEYETLHERTVRPVVMGQSSSSSVLSVIKTEVPLACDDPAYQNFLLQNLENELKSCHIKTN